MALHTKTSGDRVELSPDALAWANARDVELNRAAATL